MRRPQKVVPGRERIDSRRINDNSPRPRPRFPQGILGSPPLNPLLSDPPRRQRGAPPPPPPALGNHYVQVAQAAYESVADCRNETAGLWPLFPRWFSVSVVTPKQFEKNFERSQRQQQAKARLSGLFASSPLLTGQILLWLRARKTLKTVMPMPASQVRLIYPDVPEQPLDKSVQSHLNSNHPHMHSPHVTLRQPAVDVTEAKAPPRALVQTHTSS